MTPSLENNKQGPFESAASNVELIASNLYYTLTLNNYIIKLQSMPLPLQITIDDLMESDFVIANIIVSDALLQRVQGISA